MTDASANIIRMAGVDEAVTLADLNGVVQQVHHEALPTQFKAPDAAAVLPVFAEQSGRPEVVAFIAEVDGLPVGYVLAEEMRRDENAFTPSHSALYVHHVAVRPPARERGVGTALMLAIDAEARQRGLTEVRLDYWVFNDRAKTFFASLGFEPFNERARRPACAPPVISKRSSSRPLTARQPPPPSMITRPEAPAPAGVIRIAPAPGGWSCIVPAARGPRPTVRNHAAAG